MEKANALLFDCLYEKWLNFSQGLRNGKLSQTLDLAGIYERLVYEHNLISRRFLESKKALVSSSSDSPVLTTFFSNNVVQDFQENSDDEADERSNEEYLRDLDLEFHERTLLANSKCFVKRRNKISSPKANESTQCYKCGKTGFQLKFVPKLLQTSQYTQTSQRKPKVISLNTNKIKAKLTLLEASPSTSQALKASHLKSKGLVAETFDWDEEEVSNDEEETRVQVLMALADDELSVGKSHARNGEWVDITMKKVNNVLSMDEDSD
ncbi:hypothetical protein Tco_1535816 [Tanacetum coccineum]